jgi:hypothetical protein
MCKAMYHLVGRDIIEHETHRLGGIDASWNRSEFTLWWADVLGVTAVNWQGGNNLADRYLRYSLSIFFDDTDDVPSWRKWEGRFFG